MYCLPENSLKINTGCSEKLNSYMILSDYGLPVLKSVFMSREEVTSNSFPQKRICEYFRGNRAMLRFLYRKNCSNVKNGGMIIYISKESILREVPDNADIWLIEPVERDKNMYCFNISINRNEEVANIEVLGTGFDISDLNKGYVAAHEKISMPFPIEDGWQGEWWKRINISVCREKEYLKSREIRKKLLKSYGYSSDNLPETFRPVDMQFIEEVRNNIKKMESWILENRFYFVNFSCSVLHNGKLNFWDIQTPEGKIKAYCGNNDAGYKV